MADPFTPIHNDILEATMRQSLSPGEFRIILAVWRKTYGFIDQKVERKKFAYLGVLQLMNMTKLSETSVHRSLRTLSEKGIIKRKGAKTGFCKDFMAKGASIDSASIGSASSDSQGASSDSQGANLGTNKRKQLKKTIIKKTNFPENKKIEDQASHSKLLPKVEEEFISVSARMFMNDPAVEKLRASWPPEKREVFTWWLSQKVFHETR